MIVYSLIVRARDGLALSASTDFIDESLKGVKESQKYLKLLAKRTHHLPDRCLMNTDTHCIYLVTALGISYLSMCEPSYPTVLAFSFLNELMKEFLSKYQVLAVNQARRPYSFIEFNNTIHSARIRYNKPQSLTTRINLAELSEEIRIHPPHILSVADIQPLNGYHPINISKAAVGPSLKLEPISWFGYVIIAVAVLLSLIDVFRGFASINSYNFEDMDGPSISYHPIIFSLESLVRALQVLIFIKKGKKYLVQSWMSVLFLGALGFSVVDLRDGWQNGLRVFATGSLLWLTLQRKYQSRLPDYNV